MLCLLNAVFGLGGRTRGERGSHGTQGRGGWKASQCEDGSRTLVHVAEEDGTRVLGLQAAAAQAALRGSGEGMWMYLIECRR